MSRLSEIEQKIVNALLEGTNINKIPEVIKVPADKVFSILFNNKGIKSLHECQNIDEYKQRAIAAVENNKAAAAVLVQHSIDLDEGNILYQKYKYALPLLAEKKGTVTKLKVDLILELLRANKVAQALTALDRTGLAAELEASESVWDVQEYVNELMMSEYSGKT